MENFVLLHTYFTSIEAHNAKNHLESVGIFSQILGETNATMYNFHTPTSGGIDLYTHKEDFEKAMALLNLSQ
jgi:hypothetical protein